MTANTAEQSKRTELVVIRVGELEELDDFLGGDFANEALLLLRVRESRGQRAVASNTSLSATSQRTRATAERTEAGDRDALGRARSGSA